MQTVAFPQSSRSRHLLERLQGINFWCGSVRGSAAGLEEESGELRYGLLRPTAGSEKARAWRALTFPEQLFPISCDGSSRVRRAQDQAG